MRISVRWLHFCDEDFGERFSYLCETVLIMGSDIASWEMRWGMKLFYLRRENILLHDHPSPKVRGLSGDICCNRVPFFLKRVNFDTLKTTLLWNFTQPNIRPFKMGSQETLFYFASNPRKAQISFTLRWQNLTNRSGA
jgi:hypothetical protein